MVAGGGDEGCGGEVLTWWCWIWRRWLLCICLDLFRGGVVGLEADCERRLICLGFLSTV
ncbi:hypothetical protein A2U01_0026866, partial [Trifolium medium]|nr:hypothetical protein [Trifolium medium]